MKFILLIYGVETDWTTMGQEDMERIYRAHMAYEQEMREAGVYIGGAELKPTTEASTVRFEHGASRTVDGPYAETKEQLGGYYLIEAETLDAALAWAAKMPGCHHDCSVEVRPLGLGA
ncbi:MAG: YciI family protein [Bryobacterales bacterium]|nr:YciI family protein [Bryobacterales bacterium]